MPPLSPNGLPCVGTTLRGSRAGAGSEPSLGSPGARRRPVRLADPRPVHVSTRALIVAALLCGLAILVAFAVQVFISR